MTHQAPISQGEPLDCGAHDLHSDALASWRWTAPKMAAFLRQLSATHSVAAAARSVGMARQSAYRLRSRLKGGAFDLAWDVAFHHSYDNLAHAALERALNGVEVPVFFKGEQVGSYQRYDERLTLALLAKSTIRGNVPILGRRGPEAERHSGRFEALVAEVEAGAAGDVRVEDPGPAPSGELERIASRNVSPFSDDDFMAQFEAFSDFDEE